MKRIVLLLLVLSFNYLCAQSFLKTDGQRIVNEKGENVLLKGLGLGGWMLQEGYMLKTADFAGPQYKIEQKITELIGEKGKEEFYDAYLKNGITKADIDSLAAWGFNSVRLPMHYKLYTLPIEQQPLKSRNIWIEKGFAMTDSLLSWCAANNIYLILDLHAAPGGQGNDANISDYDTSKPSLWESEANKQLTISLWRKLAERYKKEKWIGGYDIINEPNWNFTGINKNGCDEKLNEPLRKLQMDITKAIREVDTNHIVIIEGNCWGNNYSGMFPLWDKNMVLSFHKYWNYNDDGAIWQMLQYRKEYNVPIWLGETGENSNVWFTELIELMNKHNIGWAFWPMKKIDNIAGITNVKITKEYHQLLDYWKNGGIKPDAKSAKKTLMKIADGYKLKNVEIKRDVIDVMFRQPYEITTKPFAKNNVEEKIFFSNYDLGKLNIAYYDKDVQNLWVSDSTKRSEWNSGKKMRNDGVDIYSCNDKITNGYYVGKTETGEWLQYTVPAKSDKMYELKIRYASVNNASIKFVVNEKPVKVNLNATGGNEIWKTVSLKSIKLNKGENKIKVVIENGGVNLNWFEMK